MGNAIYMEPVDGVDTVPKSRWKLVRALYHFLVLYANDTV